MSKNNTVNLAKYEEIMNRYRKGEYGSEYLSLHEILSRAGEPNLLKQMNSDELDYLIQNSSGMSKTMFIKLRDELMGK